MIEYIQDHWRGRLSLADSFWFNNVLLSLLLTGVSYLSVWLLDLSFPLRQGITDDVLASLLAGFLAAIFLIYMLGLVLVSVWQWCGLWRSATNSARHYNTVFWPVAAKAYVILGALASIKIIMTAVML